MKSFISRVFHVLGYIGWAPYAYFRMLEEQHANANASMGTNELNGQDLEAQSRNPQDEQSNHTMGLALRDSSTQQR